MPAATIRRSATDSVIGNGIAGTVKSHNATIELAASASGTTIDFGNIPSNARILGSSRIYWDDLATSGLPVLNLGLLAVNANITSNDSCLNDGLALSAVSTANVGSQVVKDFANAGKPAWGHVPGQAADPGGVLKVQGVVRAAPTTALGTITLDLYYTVDN